MTIDFSLKICYGQIYKLINNNITDTKEHTMFNNCPLPRMSSLCQGCSGGKNECTDLETALPVMEKNSEAEKKLPPAPIPATNIREMVPARTMPYSDCTKNCLPKKTAINQHCHNCTIYQRHLPTMKIQIPLPAPVPEKVKKRKRGLLKVLFT